MALEIERKFLVNKELIPSLSGGKLLMQAYLCKTPERTVRIRIADKKAFLTIKGKTIGCSCKEFEYEIPVVDAEQLLLLCEDQPIRKTRHEIPCGSHIWEIDIFHAQNEGLILAEIELSAENEEFTIPNWITREVTSNFRYYNSYLSANPFQAWDSLEH